MPNTRAHPDQRPRATCGSRQEAIMNKLDIRNLDVVFGPMQVLRQVNLSVPRGETVAIVGESGCGKTVTGLTLLRLIPMPPGRILCTVTMKLIPVKMLLKPSTKTDMVTMITAPLVVVE